MAVPSVDRQWEEFKVEVKRSNDNFKDEMVRTMREMSEQMSCLVKNQNQNVVLMHHESGAQRRTYGAPIVNNQIIPFNFAQFYYNSTLLNPC